MPDKLFGVFPIYALLIVSAIIVALILCSREERRLGLEKDTVIEMALWLVPAAVVGARLYYVAFEWERYAHNLASILYIWEGGLAIYGGVIGGAIAAFFFARKKKLSFALLADLVAPVLILGQAIGRWGNFFNGEAYGYLVENPAWQFFPAAVFVNGEWHMATFFYESIWDLAGFFLLWLNRKKVKTRGNLFLGYLVWYGIGRFFIEGLRTDSLYWGPIRVSQALSLLMVVGAGSALIIRQIRKKKAASQA
ncbi:MAG: prolipoprotein diacylglyceryl transferase [Clostridiales bacterium]|nr:prolipoprotein diacylglyceryl transferase [Clostridiales bacterium]